MAFQLLTTTTTVWIINTLFQLVSSGIKNIFQYAGTTVPSNILDILVSLDDLGV